MGHNVQKKILEVCTAHVHNDLCVRHKTHANGHVELQLGWELCKETLRKRLMFDELFLCKLADYIFLRPTDVIAWCMQNLNSIRWLRKNHEPPQGF